MSGADHDQMDRMRSYLTNMCTGWDVEQVKSIVAETLHEIVDPLVFAEAANLIADHKLCGRDVVVVSASGEEIVAPIARELGATHTVNAAQEDNLVKTLKKLTGGGADYAFECVGLGSVVAQAYGSLRKGGTAVVVGVAGLQDTTTVKTVSLALEEKTLKGSYYGSARPREDFPRLMSLYSSGKLKLDELITHRYTLEEAPQAFDDLAQGRNARGMIIFS